MINNPRILTDSHLTDWKQSFLKSGIKYETDEEYIEAVNNLVGYFELLIEIDAGNKKNIDNNQVSTED